MTAVVDYPRLLLDGNGKICCLNIDSPVTTAVVVQNIAVALECQEICRLFSTYQTIFDDVGNKAKRFAKQLASGV